MSNHNLNLEPLPPHMEELPKTRDLKYAEMVCFITDLTYSKDTGLKTQAKEVLQRVGEYDYDEDQRFNSRHWSFHFDPDYRED